MKTLVIDKSQWYRGMIESSMLRRPSDGKMCCLGFYALSCGLSKDAITTRRAPSEVDSWDTNLIKVTPSGTRINSSLCCRLMRYNDDDSGISDAVRQKRLRILFKRLGVKVVFKSKV